MTRTRRDKGKEKATTKGKEGRRKEKVKKEIKKEQSLNKDDELRIERSNMKIVGKMVLSCRAWLTVDVRRVRCQVRKPSQIDRPSADRQMTTSSATLVNQIECMRIESDRRSNRLESAGDKYIYIKWVVDECGGGGGWATKIGELASSSRIAQHCAKCG